MPLRGESKLHPVIIPSDERWQLGRPYAYGPLVVDVIEPAEKPPSQKATHPFGFSRALNAPPLEVQHDDVWEGMGL